jgi:hypothetical protein
MRFAPYTCAYPQLSLQLTAAGLVDPSMEAMHRFEGGLGMGLQGERVLVWQGLKIMHTCTVLMLHVYDVCLLPLCWLHALAPWTQPCLQHRSNCHRYCC